MDNLLSYLDGKKSYIAAIGLVGLGVYQLSVNQPEAAIQSFLAAASIFGLRNAIEKKLKV